MNITRAEALKYFDYNQETGGLSWKLSRGKKTRAGDIAGTEDKGYLRLRFNYKDYKVHRIIWLMVYGRWPYQIDHIDHNRSNNKINNLREVTAQQNAQNRSLHKNNRSGVCGVSWKKDKNKWCSEIHVNGNNVFLGHTCSLFRAACLRKSAEIKYGFHANHGNSCE